MRKPAPPPPVPRRPDGSEIVRTVRLPDQPELTFHRAAGCWLIRLDGRLVGTWVAVEWSGVTAVKHIDGTFLGMTRYTPQAARLILAHINPR